MTQTSQDDAARHGMAATYHPDDAYSIVAGGAGGLLGGVAMGLVAMVLFPLLGLGSALRPLILIGALLDQTWDELNYAAGPAIFGLLFHLAMSLALGVLFGWLVNVSRGRSVVLAGLVYSLVIWAINHLALLWLLDPAAAHGFPLWLFALSHAVYGLVLGAFVARPREAHAAQTARVVQPAVSTTADVTRTKLQPAQPAQSGRPAVSTGTDGTLRAA